MLNRCYELIPQLELFLRKPRRWREQQRPLLRDEIEDVKPDPERDARDDMAAIRGHAQSFRDCGDLREVLIVLPKGDEICKQRPGSAAVVFDWQGFCFLTRPTMTTPEISLANIDQIPFRVLLRFFAKLWLAGLTLAAVAATFAGLLAVFWVCVAALALGHF